MSKKSEGLFNSTQDGCHPVYKNLRSSARMADVRLHINALWQWYFDNGLADRNFLSQFPIQTTQRLWELETAWLLHNCGFSLSKNRAGSDFHCEGANMAFEVEAIVAGAGAEGHPNFVKEYVLTGNAQFKCSETICIPEREQTELLRLTSAIDTKAKKHICDMRKGTSDPSLPFVIALSSVDMPMLVSGWDMPAALKAVYPIGGQCYGVNPVTSKFLCRLWQCRPQVQKGTASRAGISTQVFCPGRGAPHHREVSALLYSRVDCQKPGYPYPANEHRKHFVLIHNEDCIKPLARGTITTGAEFWLEQSGPKEYILAESKIEESENDA
jgi:hypothetical protein